MFGLGKPKISAADAAVLFMDIGTRDAADQLIRWEAETSALLERMGEDPTALREVVHDNPDFVLFFVGTAMATSLLAPKNLFSPKVAEAIYTNVKRELSATEIDWLCPFVFELIKQFEARPTQGFMPYAFVKELRLGERDAALERRLLGPICLTVLEASHLILPVTVFWKRLSEGARVMT